MSDEESDASRAWRARRGDVVHPRPILAPPPPVAELKVRTPRGSLPVEGECRVCGVKFDLRRYDARGRVIGASRGLTTCTRHRWARKDDVVVDRTTPYAEDVAAQLFVATFPGPEGATLEAVAMAMGISRERVRQIEEKALRKLRAMGLRRFYHHDPDGTDEGDVTPRHDEAGGGDDEGAKAEGGSATDPGSPLEPWKQWLLDNPVRPGD